MNKLDLKKDKLLDDISPLKRIGDFYYEVSAAGKTKKIRRSKFLCHCGKEFETRISRVRSGSTKSCGCNRLASVTKHKLTHSKIYTVWVNMRVRCYKINNHQYQNYGGRGISVCDEWLVFEAFYNDMGDIPDGKSLDRINNDGNYCKENCRWATRVEQNRNSRNNRIITIDGKSECLHFWLEKHNVTVGAFYYRISTGLSDIEALGL